MAVAAAEAARREEEGREGKGREMSREPRDGN